MVRVRVARVQQVSEDMLFQKSRLEELKRTDLAEMVQDLQAAEHDRLKAVSKVQMLEQEIRGNDVRAPRAHLGHPRSIALGSGKTAARPGRPPIE